MGLGPTVGLVVGPAYLGGRLRLPLLPFFMLKLAYYNLYTGHNNTYIISPIPPTGGPILGCDVCHIRLKGAEGVMQEPFVRFARQ